MSYRGLVGKTVAESEGVTAEFDLRPGSDDDIVVDEIWFENVYRIHPDHVSGGRILDIGANIGAFSSLCLAYGASETIAFEPEPSNFVRLKEHLVNYQDRTTLINGAVSGFDGEIGFNFGGDAHTGSGSTISREAAADLVVESHGFVRVLRDAGDVAVLKMDIEGGEYACFESITPENLSNVKRITMEFHPTDAGRFGRMVELIAEWGHVEILGRPSTGGQIYGLRY